MPRAIIWFSCGGASAVLAKLGVQKYSNAQVVYCDTLINEHPDNQRFFEDIERWIEKPILKIGSRKYKSVDDVIQITRYMSGPKGARCTVELKKVPRFEFQLPDDIHLFGMTAGEEKRIERLKRNNPELCFDWILRDAGLTHDACLSIISHAGIKLPVMYDLGFNNNNCLGCLKASGVAYWARIRKFFPEIFEKRCTQSRALGVRLLIVKSKRVFLDELPAEMGLEIDDTEKIECGVVCQGEG